ncbi:hypothetical protein JTL36_36015, partial [Pseudomonas aeruginosa]|nr:hypothetical protein [Pseudomonas aeruginosa]
ASARCAGGRSSPQAFILSLSFREVADDAEHPRSRRLLRRLPVNLHAVPLSGWRLDREGWCT